MSHNQKNFHSLPRKSLSLAKILMRKTTATFDPRLRTRTIVSMTSSTPATVITKRKRRRGDLSRKTMRTGTMKCMNNWQWRIRVMLLNRYFQSCLLVYFVLSIVLLIVQWLKLDHNSFSFSFCKIPTCKL